jgi:tetratricopeptide (TPR) repeat protein
LHAGLHRLCHRHVQRLRNLLREPAWEAQAVADSNAALLFSLGTTLAKLSNSAEGEERKQLLLDACLKLQEALRHREDEPNERDEIALTNLSYSLLCLARTEEGAEKLSLLYQAADRAREANDVGRYNLACVLSQLQSFDEASTLLRADLKLNPQERSHALQDPDLAPLWQARPEFRREIEEQLAQEPSPSPLTK